jgi:low temperature requirement protein LtrA
MSSNHHRLRIEATESEASVTPLELFFDLVFVFGLTQVTSLMDHDLSAHGLVRGLLVLSLLWWSWVGYAWLGNVVRADEGAARLAMLAAMAAMFVMALAIPEAFDDRPGGLTGPVVVGICYFAFRALHLVLFWIIASDDPGLRGQLVRFAPSMLGGTTLLLVASQLHGSAQTIAWAGALAADYGGTLLAGASGWRLRSPHHFAERHGLIVIVALGESIVAIGVGFSGRPISWPAVLAAVTGLALAAALWWTYFDVTSILAERGLAAAPDEERARLARDAYSYLHLPIVAGVALVALGLTRVLGSVGIGEQHVDDRLGAVPVVALYGGVALFLLAHVAFKRRMTEAMSVHRIVVGAVVLALIPVAARLPALVALGVLVGVAAAMVAFEKIRFAEERELIRHEPAGDRREADRRV